MSNQPGNIRAYTNLLSPPVMDRSDINYIEIRDRFGDMNAILFRGPHEDMFTLCTKKDRDWAAILTQRGYLNPSKAETIKSILG